MKHNLILFVFRVHQSSPLSTCLHWPGADSRLGVVPHEVTILSKMLEYLGSHIRGMRRSSC